MSERFYIPGPLLSDNAVLTAQEAHHFLHVMRGKVGQQVTVFDGLGSEYPAQVTKLSRSEVQLALAERREVSRELAVEVCVGVALPKGDRQKWLVEKLTELGVKRLVPLETRRGVAQPTEAAVARLQRHVVEACKQCGRNVLMTLAAPQQVEDFLQSGASVSHKLFADTATTHEALQGIGKASQLWVAIGPEGGWAEEERQAALRHGWQNVSLGLSVLRVETAAIAVAAWAALTAAR